MFLISSWQPYSVSPSFLLEHLGNLVLVPAGYHSDRQGSHCTCPAIVARGHHYTILSETGSHVAQTAFNWLSSQGWP